MVRVIERRHDKKPNEKMLTLKVEHDPGEPNQVVGSWSYVLPHERGSSFAGTPPNESVPVEKAFVSALAFCEEEGLDVLCVHDPENLFPSEKRPASDLGSA